MKINHSFTIIILTFLLILNSCNKDKVNSSNIIPNIFSEKSSFLSLIKKGNYSAENYKYPDFKKWKKEEPKSISFNNRKPNELFNDSITKISSSSLQTGSINKKTGANIYTKNNFKSDIITTLPIGSSVNILNIENEFKQYKTQTSQNLNGRWLEVKYYSKNNDTISGYILDDFINYHFEDLDSYSTTDERVIVRNEKEFIAALGSFKTIEILTDTLNFEKYFQNEVIKDDWDIVNKITSSEISSIDGIDFYGIDFYDMKKVWGEKYFMTHTSNNDYEFALGLNNYNDLIIKGKDKPVIFTGDEEILTINKCADIVFENIHFFTTFPRNGNPAVSVLNSNSITFNNVNLINTEGADVIDSNKIIFKNCDFYNNSNTVIEVDDCDKMSIDNCNFYNNNSSNNILDINSLDKLTLTNSSFINNKLIKREGSTRYIRTGASIIKSWYSKLITSNCHVINNHTQGALYSADSYSSFKNFVFKNNTGSVGNSIFEGYKYKIKINDSDIQNNNNYYSLNYNSKHESSLEDDKFKKDSLTKTYNLFDKRTDSINFPCNSVIINNNSYRVYKYDYLLKTENNQIITKKDVVLNGFHKIKFPYGHKKYLSFFDLNLSFLPKSKDAFNYGYGNVKKGKLDGVWRFTDRSDEYYILDITFKDGLAVGETFFLSEEDSLLVRGKYLNNKKVGEWIHYNLEGDILKKNIYKDVKF